MEEEKEGAAAHLLDDLAQFPLALDDLLTLLLLLDEPELERLELRLVRLERVGHLVAPLVLGALAAPGLADDCGRGTCESVRVGGGEGEGREGGDDALMAAATEKRNCATRPARHQL